jgi:hypothetical protein
MLSMGSITFSAICTIFFLQTSGFHYSNLKIGKPFISSSRQMSPLLSNPDDAKKIEIEKASSSYNFQRWIKKLLLPARKLVTSSAILGASALPLRTHSSPTPSAVTAITATQNKRKVRVRVRVRVNLYHEY